MSAPTSHDPLVVNTADGSCWVRRAKTQDGRGLYALEGASADVPELVLASLRDLAEIGLRSMADVLPVPVGPEPQAPAPELALPWAHAMSDDDLPGFLDDLVSAAMGRWRSEPEVPDRVVLADIEKVCADWRTPGEGLRGDPAPEPVPDAVTRKFVPVQALREDSYRSPLHHDYRVGHDMPETGGTR